MATVSEGTANPLVIIPQSHFLSEGTAGSIGINSSQVLYFQSDASHDLTRTRLRALESATGLALKVVVGISNNEGASMEVPSELT